LTSVGGSGGGSGIVGDGWVDGNSEFVGAVRLTKLLAGELEPSGVRENRLGFMSSVSLEGSMKESGESVAAVCDDVASWLPIDEREAKRPCAPRGCFFQDAAIIQIPCDVACGCDGYRVSTKNVVVRWYAGS
jgi:hypothetical protein